LQNNYKPFIFVPMEQLTHFKKNLDSRYISGEDLQAELKGLKKEMNVVITRFDDAEAFDQKSQSKSIKTGFFLSNYPSNVALHKPVLLNSTNADFLRKEFGSDFMEHWLNKPFCMYAKADKRFGHVVRFKSYVAPYVDDKKALELLGKCKTKGELKTAWDSLSAQEKLVPSVMAMKDSLKDTL
jgi:hypothetical protein